MPKGLKQTSSSLAIGFGVEQTAANTFIQGQIDLNLSPLDREVFVVQAINLDPNTPDSVAGVTTRCGASLTSTSQTATVELNNSNCLASASNLIKQNVSSTDGTAFQTGFFESPTAIGLDYIGIIATNDFFVQLSTSNCVDKKAVFGKLYGYRAIADADIYAALVQSEVLSA